MRVAMGQMNSYLGDFAGNRKKILLDIKRAHAERAELIIFPEAALFGYHPVDLLERESVVEDQIKELKRLEKSIPEGIGVLVGALTKSGKKTGKPYFNSALFFAKGKKAKVFPKELLPTYDVFDEARHIEPGDLAKNILRWKGQKILVTICEDIWGWPSLDRMVAPSYSENPLKKHKPGSVDFVVNLSASPFTIDRKQARLKVVEKTAKYFKAPVIYVNMVGAQDELIFDGASFVVNRRGEVVESACSFKEDLVTFNLAELKPKRLEPPISADALRRQATILGIQDFVRKTGLKSVHLGLSGGVDSAVVATLAAEAVGGDRLHCIAMPSRFNSPNSLIWAKKLSENLGAHWYELPIESTYCSAIETLEDEFGGLEFGLVHENAQARVRCLFLMAFSNLKESLLLNPSNKSELAMGYSTLYGDLSGGLSVIGDYLKTEVFSMARHLNSNGEIIPTEIIERPPSAELRLNQKDTDSLPPYEELDRVITKLVIFGEKATSKEERRVLSAMIKSEFKRWQAPPILKVSTHAFGRGRRFPVAHRSVK
ncbi:NAD+ synthase [Bdellovibrionales bacterium]|nr:NAD+ synthase [Bdellovibrionales bacterium]